MSEKVVRCPYMDEKLIPEPTESFAETLWNAIQNYRAKVALVEISGGRKLTYDELVMEITKVASQLLTCGCRRGDVVAIISPNSIDWLVCCFALMRIGATPAAISSLLMAGELEHQIKTCNATFVFTVSSHVPIVTDAVRNLSAKVIVNSSETPRGCVNLRSFHATRRLPSFSELKLDIDERAFIFFSSGTTGLQKAVMLSHRNLYYGYISSTHPKCRIVDDPQLIYPPMSHVVGGLYSMYGSALGYTSYIVKKFNMREYLQAAQDGKMMHLLMVSPTVGAMAKSPETANYNLEAFRDVSVGAAPLGGSVELLLIEKYPKIQIRQYYGLTEVTALVTCVPYEEGGPKKRKPGSIGLPMPGSVMKVVDVDTGKALGPNTRGEICAKTQQRMIGYLNNPQATKDMMAEDGWIRTGDMGYYDEDGYFYMVDRRKELVKYNAFQVSPAELEAVILTNPDIVDAGVFGVEDAAAGELPAAWVVARPGSKIDEAQLRQFVEQRVAPYKRLRGGVRFVPAIPKTESGKILRRRMREEMKRVHL